MNVLPHGIHQVFPGNQVTVPGGKEEQGVESLGPQIYGLVLSQESALPGLQSEIAEAVDAVVNGHDACPFLQLTGNLQIFVRSEDVL
jgi:hypothetical protein